MKIAKKILVLTICFCLGLGSVMVQNSVWAKSKKIKLNKTKVTIKVKKTVKLKLKNAKASKVKWTSSNKKVAKVSKKGLVTAKKAGKATIKAKYKKKTYKAKIKVVAKKKNVNKEIPLPIDGNELSQGIYLVDKLYDGSNILVSPSSINMALGMAANGADYEAEASLEKYLGRPIVQNNIRANNLINHPHDDSLKYSNSFWYKTGFVPENRFKLDLEMYYNADFYETPMNKVTVDEVNNWCAQKTDNRIKKIIDEGDLDINSRSLVVNALLFDGKWTDEFSSKAITKMNFSAFDGKTYQVDMMKESLDAYYENEYAQAFEKTYGADAGYSFIGILPKEKGQFNLSDLNIVSLLKTKKNEDVNIGLPKFEYGWNKSLKKPLEETCINNVFDNFNPHFSKILSNTSLYVEDVIHATNIKVGEKGTEAAAVTVIDLSAKSALHVPTKPHNVILNRPFAYVIVDNAKKEILFVGKVTNFK